VSNTKKGSKGPGYEYWGKRPMSKEHGAIPGKFTKKRTHKIERKENKNKAKEDE
jgi:hypothetical protein